MNIRLVRKESRKTKAFNKKEWAEANRSHFGSAVKWNSDFFILEAYDKKELVGTLNCKIGAGVAYIGELIVARNKRGRGIGRQLMARTEEVAKAKKAHKIYLSTGKDWDAVNFYKILGYKITGKLPNHYFHHDFVELTKFL